MDGMRQNQGGFIGGGGDAGLGIDVAAQTPSDPRALIAPKEDDGGSDVFLTTVLNLLTRGQYGGAVRLDALMKDRKAAKELQAMERQRREATSNLGRAYAAYEAGDLTKAAELGGSVYGAFPDGVEFGGVREEAPGMDGMGEKTVFFKDKQTGKLTSAFPITQESVGEALEEARAGLQPETYMKARVSRLMDIQLQNRENLKKAKYDEGTNSYSWFKVAPSGTVSAQVASGKDYKGMLNKYDDEADKIQKELSREKLAILKEKRQMAKTPQLKSIGGVPYDRDPMTGKVKPTEGVAKQPPTDLEKATLGLKQAQRTKAEQELKSKPTFKVPNVQTGKLEDRTRKQIDAEIKTLSSVLKEVTGPAPLIMTIEDLEAKDKQTELGRYEKLAKDNSKPDSVRKAAKRMLTLIKAVLGESGEKKPGETVDSEEFAKGLLK